MPLFFIRGAYLPVWTNASLPYCFLVSLVPVPAFGFSWSSTSLPEIRIAPLALICIHTDSVQGMLTFNMLIVPILPPFTLHTWSVGLRGVEAVLQEISAHSTRRLRGGIMEHEHWKEW